MVICYMVSVSWLIILIILNISSKSLIELRFVDNHVEEGGAVAYLLELGNRTTKI